MIIKDNRIVSDMTFATRLANFLNDINVSDPASLEELGYLKHVAYKLLVHQRDTAVTESERAYLLRCWPSGIIDGDNPETKALAKELIEPNLSEEEIRKQAREFVDEWFGELEWEKHCEVCKGKNTVKGIPIINIDGLFEGSEPLAGDFEKVLKKSLLKNSNREPTFPNRK